MSTMVLAWIAAGLVVLIAAAIVMYVVIRRRTPRFETYQPGEYHSIEEAATGPGAQHPLSHPPAFHVF